MRIINIKKGVLLALAVFLFLSPVAAHGESVSPAIGIITPSVRVEAPAFTLTDLAGRKVSLDEYKGKVLLINFWATWCAPCRDEMPALEKLWQHFKEKGFVVLAISVDRSGSRGVRKFAERHGITFPVLLDPEGEVREYYEISSLPTSYIVARDGSFSGKIIGTREWDSDVSVAFFEDLVDR